MQNTADVFMIISFKTWAESWMLLLNLCSNSHIVTVQGLCGFISSDLYLILTHSHPVTDFWEYKQYFYSVQIWNRKKQLFQWL